MSKTTHIVLAVLAALAVLSLIIFKPAPSLQELSQSRAEVMKKTEGQQ